MAMRARLADRSTRSNVSTVRGTGLHIPSLEALQHYTAGYSEMVRGNSLAAVPLFERAIALDPNFAVAYQFLRKIAPVNLRKMNDIAPWHVPKKFPGSPVTAAENNSI